MTELLGGVLSATIPAGDRVLLHVASGTYLRLDGAAGAIVDLLVSHGSEEAASGALAARYGLPPDRAAADVSSVVTALQGLRPARAGRGCPAPARLVADWCRLPAGQRRAAAGALAVLGVVEVGLRHTDVARLAATLHVPLADGAQADPPTPSDLSDLPPRLRRRLLGLDWALAHWVAPGTCLRRALATGFLLRHRQPVLRLGMTADGVTAHAWVEAAGRSYDPGRTVGTFRALR